MGAREYQRLLEEAERLDAKDQERLLADLTALMRRQGSRRARSILELRGLGKEVWHGVDAQEYVERERAAWTG